MSKQCSLLWLGTIQRIKDYPCLWGLRSILWQQVSVMLLKYPSEQLAIGVGYSQPHTMAIERRKIQSTGRYLTYAVQ